MAYLSQIDSLLPEGTRPQQVRSVDTPWLIEACFWRILGLRKGTSILLGHCIGGLCCECLEIFISKFLNDGRGILSGRLLLLEFQ